VALILVEMFDLSTLSVGASGGLTAALVGRRRRHETALGAGVLIGSAGARLEACRAIEAARTYAELWSAGEAPGGGPSRAPSH
jgi:hypothetical protein